MFVVPWETFHLFATKYPTNREFKLFFSLCVEGSALSRPSSDPAAPGAPLAQLGRWLCPPCPHEVPALLCFAVSLPVPAAFPLLCCPQSRTDLAEPLAPPSASGCSAEGVNWFKPRLFS